MACSTLSHEKALHNYFIPCLNLRKGYGNFGKSSEIYANVRKLRKRFKPVFEKLKRSMKLLENFGNSSKVFSRWLYDFLKSSENFGNPRKSSEIFGKLRKRFKSNFQSFYNFFRYSENLWKCSEIFGKFRTEELKSFRVGF